MAYTCVFTFTGHTDSVNTLEFSPRAQFLASGGDDGILYILDFKTGREVRKLVGTSPITALCWHPSYRNSLFAGYGDGRVVLENTGIDQPEGYTFPHNATGPVEHIVFDRSSGFVAFCIDLHVHLWQEVPEMQWSYMYRLPLPPRVSALQFLPVSPRSAHFVDQGRSLVVSYLHDGIICWNLSSKSPIWRINTRTGRIGRSSISPDEQLLAVSNLSDGFDLYQIGSRKLLRTLHATAKFNVPLPVLFINDGAGLLTGSSVGAVRIYDVATALPMQKLSHGEDIIQAIASIGGTIKYIATASSEKGAETYVKIWQSIRSAPLDAIKIVRECPPSLAPDGIKSSPSQRSQIKQYRTRGVNTAQIMPQESHHDDPQHDVRRLLPLRARRKLGLVSTTSLAFLSLAICIVSIIVVNNLPAVQHVLVSMSTRCFGAGDIQSVLRSFRDHGEHLSRGDGSMA